MIYLNYDVDRLIRFISVDLTRAAVITFERNPNPFKLRYVRYEQHYNRVDNCRQGKLSQQGV